MKTTSIFICIMLYIMSPIVCAQNDILSHNLQSYLDESLASHTAPGAVMLVANEKIGTLIFASGESNIATHEKIKTSDTFRIASMSKTFMAAAILKLVDQHKLSLDEFASHYLPAELDLKKIPNAETVTIRQLLQMRSGIPDYYLSDKYNALFENNTHHVVTATEAIKTLYGEKALFAPGKKSYYSNSNYVLLQIILENVTHKSFANAMQELLFQPLGLKNTYVTEEKYFNDKNYQRLTTHGYAQDENYNFIDVTKKFDGNGLGDGAVVTSADELYHFLKALLVDKTVISADSLKEMLNFLDDYGLGIGVEKVAGDTYYTHNGDASGYSGQYYVDSGHNWVIILSNSDESDFFETLSDKVYQNL